MDILLLTVVIKKGNRKKKMIVPETETETETEAEDVDHIKPANNLQFERGLTSNTMRYQIWLPKEFARETGLNSKQKVTLKYISEGGVAGEEWPVKIQKREVKDGYRFRLAVGWLNFFNGEGLSIGDLCLFEFVRGSLHVKVLRKKTAG
ncbi:hypothetical protein ACFE04_024429 [Oxalis oulophora]